MQDQLLKEVYKEDGDQEAHQNHILEHHKHIIGVDPALESEVDGDKQQRSNDLYQ